VSAAYATKLLADLGADVVKIETPGRGDVTRRRGPFPGDVPHPEKSGLFLYLNANKRGITLDLTQASARDALARLVRRRTCSSTTSTRPTWPRAASTTSGLRRTTLRW